MVQIDGVDLSRAMIDQARARLQDDESRVRFVHGDMELVQFTEMYSACVAVLSVHHLEGQKKKTLFQKVYDVLEPGAVFVLGDIVIGDTVKETTVMEEEWMQFLLQGLGEERAKYWFDNYVEEDRPSSARDQTTWLREAGFSEVEVLWEHINYVVIRAVK